jgi:hypothetical protein
VKARGAHTFFGREAPAASSSDDLLTASPPVCRAKADWCRSAPAAFGCSEVAASYSSLSARASSTRSAREPPEVGMLANRLHKAAVFRSFDSPRMTSNLSTGTRSYKLDMRFLGSRFPRVLSTKSDLAQAVNNGGRAGYPAGVCLQKLRSPKYENSLQRGQRVMSAPAFQQKVWPPRHLL